MKKIPRAYQKNLLDWFHEHKRPLPWRKTKDPYSVWVSEVMLQQTTSKAVVSYYKKFLKRFPNVEALAKATKEEVFSLWVGLGYYQRAENLIKAAKQIQKTNCFPKTYKELILLPGFGDYTSRAVSSICFQEPVGVVDGNVIRFLSRFYAKPFEVWKSKDKQHMQQLADLWVQEQNSKDINQALMEIGSLICTHQNPACFICPLSKHCLALKNQSQHLYPVKKKKKETELWHWKVQKLCKDSKWAFAYNPKVPFLKKKLVFLGAIKKVKERPKHYDVQHSIMHYRIFVSLQNKNLKINNKDEVHWLSQKEIQKQNPSSLITKILNL